jgi:hypothetical protein
MNFQQAGFAGPYKLAQYEQCHTAERQWHATALGWSALGKSRCNRSGRP